MFSCINFSDLCSLKQLLLTLDILDREGIRKHELFLILKVLLNLSKGKTRFSTWPYVRVVYNRYMYAMTSLFKIRECCCLAGEAIFEILYRANLRKSV